MERRFAVRRNKKQNGTFICTSCSKEVEAESEVCPYCNEIFVKGYKLNLRLFLGIWRLFLALFVFLFYLFPKWGVQAFAFVSDPIAGGVFLGELAAVYLALIWPGLKRLKLLPYKEIYLHKDY
jgi:DNA-directed RNA polymerase subunit RPC12/RpoP